jgi:ankyrin repeat protein
MNKPRETPLEEAIMCESVSMVEALLANGADMTSVHNMAMDSEGAKMILKRPDIAALIGAETQRRVLVEEEAEEAAEAVRMSQVAFAMGTHKRLGTESRVQPLLPEVLRIIFDFYVNQ